MKNLLPSGLYQSYLLCPTVLAALAWRDCCLTTPRYIKKLLLVWCLDVDKLECSSFEVFVTLQAEELVLNEKGQKVSKPIDDKAAKAMQQQQMLAMRQKLEKTQKVSRRSDTYLEDL